jgi:hypothetical protein
LKAFFRDILILSVTGTSLYLLTIFLVGRYPFFSDAEHSPFLVPLFLGIFCICIVIAHAGKSKTADVQVLYNLTATGLKFLLPAILAVVWFRLLKNSSDADVLLFFVVYLAFGITTVLLIIKRLKNLT